MPIFDQGYQHWKGPLAGHGWRCLAITRQGLRVACKSWIVRIVLALAWLPALALIVALALWGLFEQGSESVLKILQPMLPPGVAADPHAFRQAIWTIAYSMYFKLDLPFIMLLLVVAGPGLISRDLRFNALPLYLSRPLTRRDYFLGKLGVIAGLVGAVAVVPAFLAYILGICFSLDLGVIRDTWRLLPGSILYGLVIVASTGPLMLALSSLSRRSLYVGITWAGLWIISGTVAGVLGGVAHMSAMHAAMQEEGPTTAATAPHGRAGHWKELHARAELRLAAAAPTDWRPLCSYTANLKRLGESLLNTDAAWVQIGRAVEAPRITIQSLQSLFGGGHGAPANVRRLADYWVPQYPWPWSAGVLAGLLGLSLWILSLRIKSLDRLR